MTPIIRALVATRSRRWDWLIRQLWFWLPLPAAFVCVCVYYLLRDAWIDFLVGPLAAHSKVLLICWSNHCQNTPGDVASKGWEEGRQCLLSRSQDVICLKKIKQLITSTVLSCEPKVLFKDLILSLRWPLPAPLAFRPRLSLMVYRLCIQPTPGFATPKLLPKISLMSHVCFRIGVCGLTEIDDSQGRKKENRLINRKSWGKKATPGAKQRTSWFFLLLSPKTYSK